MPQYRGRTSRARVQPAKNHFITFSCSPNLPVSGKYSIYSVVQEEEPKMVIVTAHLTFKVVYLVVSWWDHMIVLA
jgi:hypothetical protein